MKKVFKSVIFAVLIVAMLPVTIFAKEEPVYHVNYAYTQGVEAYLSINGSAANCSIVFRPNESSSKMSGTLTLYDVSGSKAISTWSVSLQGNTRSISKTANVERGHKYRLTFSGKVTTKNGASEYVSCSTERQN